MKNISVNLILVLVYFVHISVFAFENFSKIEEISVDSQILGEKRELVIYLPADYEKENKNFPVLYITDGDIQGPHTKVL
jgi:hypothetical protein